MKPFIKALSWREGESEEACPCLMLLCKHLLWISGSLSNQENVPELYQRMAGGSHSWWLHLAAVASSFRLPSLRVIQKTQSENQFKAILLMILQTQWSYLENSKYLRKLCGWSNVCRHRRFSWEQPLGRRKEGICYLDIFAAQGSVVTWTEKACVVACHLAVCVESSIRF